MNSNEVEFILWFGDGERSTENHCLFTYILKFCDECLFRIWSLEVVVKFAPRLTYMRNELPTHVTNCSENNFDILTIIALRRLVHLHQICS